MRVKSNTSPVFLVALFCVELVTAFTIPRYVYADTRNRVTTSAKHDLRLHSSLSYIIDETVGAGEPFPLVKKLFPGAIPYSQMLNSLASNLVERGFHIPKTLCATSLCCDELNRPLERALVDIFDTNYSLGGMAGCPFGGLTSFQKMKMHIPDGGNCVILYGTHVGVNSQGKVGTVERSNCKDGDKCCRSAMLAADYVMGVLDGEPLAPIPTDPYDVSQYYVGTMLMPHAKRLKYAPDPMVELPYALYEAQTELMTRIIKEGSQYGQFPGTVAVMGGIQINTPPGMVDYFVPLNFDFYDGNGKLEETLIKTDTQPSTRPSTEWVWD